MHIVTPESVGQTADVTTGGPLQTDDSGLNRRQDKLKRRSQFDENRVTSQQSTRPASPAEDEANEVEAEHPRILLSARGEKVYVGSSAAISFLQFLRRLLRHYGGKSAFTESRTRHHMLEVTAQESHGEFEDSLTHSERASLIRCFLASTSGFMCLFPEDEAFRLLSSYESGRGESAIPAQMTQLGEDDLASMYLILAIGACCRSSNESDKRVASTFFARGQQIAFRDMLHDPTINMVINFVLMAFYMFACSRRNSGLLYLGIASKAATILGLHVMELNKGLRPETARRRLAAWKSLRTLDVQCNAILGRPSSTPHVASENWRMGPDQATHRSLAVNANFDLSLLMEPISQKLTRQAALDLDAAEVHLQKLRAWAKALPEPLRQSIRKAPRDVPSDQHLEKTIGNVHVACAYYFGVMLVTRHFLIATLTPKVKRSHLGADQRLEDLREAEGTDKTTQLSNVCIEAAVHLSQMCSDASDRELLLENMCILQAWLFAASLVLGFSQMVPSKDSHQDAPQAFDDSIRVVERLSKLSAQSQRNHEILTSFSNAISAYHARVEREQASLENPYLEQIIRPSGSGVAIDGQDGMNLTANVAAGGMPLNTAMSGEPVGNFNDMMWPEMQTGFLVPQMNDEIGFQLFWDGYSPPLLAGMQMQNDDMSVPPWA
ncbi:fungal specific transcription factor domain-containing protein [Sarocladium implicatum]|nr:fungal specific transcription factor domain-containing protein [Sarocladium implicatum]